VQQPDEKDGEQGERVRAVVVEYPLTGMKNEKSDEGDGVEESGSAKKQQESVAAKCQDAPLGDLARRRSHLESGCAPEKAGQTRERLLSQVRDAEIVGE
jgi:hypothetical protein